MSADILQFIPRGRTENQERAFWKGPLDGPDREAILRAGAVEIESVRVVTPADSAPETCLINRKKFVDGMFEPYPTGRYADTAPAEVNPDGESA